MKVPFVDLQAQHRPIRDELDKAISGVMDRGDFVLGEEVERFEHEFAAYCGVKYGVGVDSGLSALELSLRAFNIGPGDEVIVPTYTFMATAAAVSFAGAEPVFVDISPLTYTLDVRQVEAKLSQRTRAIVPVHLFGLPADMGAINRIAERHGLLVVEDSAQAHGATYQSRRTGSLGHAGAFSFYPSKNLGGIGDGGIVVTNDARAAERIRAMRNCGQVVKNRHEYAPYNHRLDTLQAAVLRVKLRHLDKWNEARRQVASEYDRLLDNSSIASPISRPGCYHVYHLYVVRSSNRNDIQARLMEHNIGFGIHYPTPVHLQPYYAYKNHRWGAFPISEELSREILSLPIYPGMSLLQVHLVAAALGMQTPMGAPGGIVSSHAGLPVRPIDQPSESAHNGNPSVS